MAWLPVLVPIAVTPRWTRLLLAAGSGVDGLVASSSRDPHALLVGGPSPGGVTETSGGSAVVVADCGAADYSRAVDGASWFWPVTNHLGQPLSDVGEWIPELRIQFVATTQGKGLLVLAGVTNDTSLAGVHSEQGLYLKVGDAFGRGRVGSSTGISDGLALAQAVVYEYIHEVRGGARYLHSHVECRDATKAQIIPNGKLAINGNLARTGVLCYYLSICRLGNSDGLAWPLSVIVSAKTPILQVAS